MSEPISMRKQPKYTETTPVPGTTIIASGVGGNPRTAILIATPTLGNVRVEWAISRYGQVIPCNWTSHDVNVGVGYLVPMHYLVADAQNIATEHLLVNKFEWLLLWEDDVIAPIDLFTRLDPYIRNADHPVVSGLYFLKTPRSEPVCYRGRGTRYFGDFKLGDRFWVDGVPTGMLLIHRSVLQVMYDESPEYQTLGGKRVRKVFETPSSVFQDSVTGEWNKAQGTSDLAWCRRVIKEKVLARAGWKKAGKMEFPFLVDSNILCRHIDLNTGMTYPSEEVLKRYRR